MRLEGKRMGGCVMNAAQCMLMNVSEYDLCNQASISAPCMKIWSIITHL